MNFLRPGRSLEFCLTTKFPSCMHGSTKHVRTFRKSLAHKVGLTKARFYAGLGPCSPSSTYAFRINRSVSTSISCSFQGLRASYCRAAAPLSVESTAGLDADTGSAARDCVVVRCDEDALDAPAKRLRPFTVICETGVASSAVEEGASSSSSAIGAARVPVPGPSAEHGSFFTAVSTFGFLDLFSILARRGEAATMPRPLRPL